MARGWHREPAPLDDSGVVSEMLSQPFPHCKWGQLPGSFVMSRPSTGLATCEGAVMNAATAFSVGLIIGRHFADAFGRSPASDVP
ncbi:hypothetical protein BQ8794_240218 [Mesorhizobium prunaredense]|uniref:Uncharacterized protein n=1 Tax=Mesorhizobium prunaredense TaxID=1631249 RepID=A0A1R3V9S9_9HYPH|nr:hypothetical protein BQ8794_240218 [Mesorhizobium prunaredense]